MAHYTFKTPLLLFSPTFLDEEKHVGTDRWRLIVPMFHTKYSFYFLLLKVHHICACFTRNIFRITFAPFLHSKCCKVDPLKVTLLFSQLMKGMESRENNPSSALKYMMHENTFTLMSVHFLSYMYCILLAAKAPISRRWSINMSVMCIIKKGVVEQRDPFQRFCGNWGQWYMVKPKIAVLWW